MHCKHEGTKKGSNCFLDQYNFSGAREAFQVHGADSEAVMRGFTSQGDGWASVRKVWGKKNNQFYVSQLYHSIRKK